MKTIFGLFDQKEQAEAVAEFARRSNITDEHLKVLDSGSPAHDLVEPSPRPETSKGIRAFAILGTLIFAVFGAFAAVGSVTSTSAPVSFAIQVFLVFVIIGFLAGVGLGFVKGRSDGEEEIQHFREAFEHGAIMVVIEADQHVEGFVEEMRRQGGKMIQVCKYGRPMPDMTGQDLQVSAAH
ncbi:MAG: hypothetical protein KDI07_03415 [Anaerolineae bacterium]|nr:hypothetical protein [Anaerolineae bacterium]MCB9132586.1 hypothetical protein [Anaerolineales bacterium]MCB0230410.1 hypothetical protein [Anaerolineae bacterium]MCB0247601.1 hypothetical protein [Anaerolineae bacterium]MCB9141699.1 hypothetical protein [Anaerolineales bacterium]